MKKTHCDLCDAVIEDGKRKTVPIVTAHGLADACETCHSTFKEKMEPIETALKKAYAASIAEENRLLREAFPRMQTEILEIPR